VSLAFDRAGLGAAPHHQAQVEAEAAAQASRVPSVVLA